MKWSVLANVTELRSFVGVAQYLRKFIASFLMVATPLHTITESGNSFQWGKEQHKDFDELNKKNGEAPNYGITKLATIILSGDICEWV